jgi:2-polyprenyl-3-methyl-5-hydroxy-6-metoxy-1,4-benzoquinol methylase
MKDYWNARFENEGLMWGIEPSDVVVKFGQKLKENNVKDILIIGIGYGRNGKFLIENGYNVDGIELSEEAIKLGEKFCPKIKFINASFLDINLNKEYDAIFCYSILHLFKEKDRKRIIENCIKHCRNNGLILLSCFSVNDKTFGTGNKIEDNTYEIKNGKTVHFFTESEIINIDKNLEIICYNYSLEKIETENRKEEYKMIYGIYKKKA